MCLTDGPASYVSKRCISEVHERTRIVFIYDWFLIVKACLQVRIVDMSQESYTENDVVIIGTDGLWDVIPNLKALEIVSNSLAQFELDNQQR